MYVCGQGIKSLNFVIYNRWGEKVFENDDASTTGNCASYCCRIGKGWDGGNFSPQVFVYYLEVTYTDNEMVTQKGNITLVR